MRNNLIEKLEMVENVLEGEDMGTLFFVSFVAWEGLHPLIVHLWTDT
jgi:hypothetical protein